MSLTEALLTEAGGMRGLEAGSNRVREDYGAVVPPNSYSDNFNRADASTLGSPWTVVTGAVAISGNKVVCTGAQDQTHMYDATLTADQWVEGEMGQVDGTNGSLGPALRIVNVGGSDRSLYYAWINTQTAGAPFLQLWRNSHGTYTQLGANYPLNSVSNRIRLEAEVSSIRVYANDVLAITVTDTANTTGKAGMNGYSDGGTRFDNFRCGVLPYIPLTHTDDFSNTPNGLLHNGSFMWTDVGSVTVTGNKVVTVADSTEHTNMWAVGVGLDHSAEADVVITAGGGHADCSVNVRLNGATGDCYFLTLTTDAPGGTLELWKRTGNSGFSRLDILTNVGYSGHIKLTAVGSTLTAYLDGFQMLQVTDTTWATSTHVGISTYSTGATGSLDNFDAATIVPPPTFVGYRTFDVGQADKVVVSVGRSTAQTLDEYSQFAMVRPLAAGGGASYTWFSAERADTSRVCYWYLNWTGYQETDNNSGFTSGGPTTGVSVADGWVLIGMTKPAGEAPTYHKYVASTKAWTHEAGGSLPAVAAIGAGGFWYLGHDVVAGETWYGDIAAETFFSRALTTLEVEALPAGLSRWVDLDPAHCWPMDQTPVNDYMGSGGADQVSITGAPIAAGLYSPLLIDAPPIYTDDFNRADGALTTPWVSYEGSLLISGNKVIPASGGPHVYYYDALFSADQWAEGDMTGWGGGGIDTSPILRVTATGDFYYLWAGNTSSLEIIKRVGGIYTSIATGGTMPSAFKARIEAEGTTIRAYINGVLTVTVTDSSIPTGKPGIIGVNGPTPTLDNFRCGSLPYTPGAAYVVATTVTDGGPGILTVDKPAGGQAGDYYIVWYQVGDYTSGGGAPDPVISGFTTEPGGAKGINMAHNCWMWKKYSGSEGSTFTITGTESSHWSGMICYLVRGLPPTWTPAVAHAGAQGGNITLQSVYVPENTLMLVSHKDWNNSAPTSVPAAWTQVARFGPHTGYSYVLEGGESGKSTIVPTFGTRALSSVLYAKQPNAFNDDFDRPDTNRTAGGTDGDGLGPEWFWSTDWQIESNRAHRQTGSDFTVYSHDLQTGDHWVEGDIYPDTHGISGYGCLNLRDGPDNASNGYLGFWAPDQRWVIGSVIGSYVDLTSVSSGGIPTFPLHLRFTAQGNVLRLYNNDSLVASYTGAARLTGYNYVGMNAGGEPTVNNFRCGPMPYRYPLS